MNLLAKIRGAIVRITAMTDGQLLVGQTDAAPLPKTLTGDVTITSAGVTADKYNPSAKAAPATGTAIPVTTSGSFPITQNGAETNSLAIPTFVGQRINLYVDTDTSGARVVTSAARINQALNTVITMSEVGDFIALEAITIAGALRWQVVANDGCVLS